MEHSKVESEYYKSGGKRFFNYPIGDKNVKEACDRNNYISGSVVDGFNRYKEDVSIMKNLGMNCYRFSIDWSRIEPEKGKISEEGIRYYFNLIQELKRNDIEPFLTCWHWTLPLWLEEEGGLLSKNIVNYFEKYVETLVENFGNDVKYWMTINEPLVVSTSSYLQGKWPPQKKNIFLFYKVCFINLVNMHKVGYESIKKFDESIHVSFAKNNQRFRAYEERFFNKVLARMSDFFVNEFFINRVKNYLDYISLNFYFDHEVCFSGLRDKYKKRSDIGWGLEPYSLYYVLRDLGDRYHLPVYVTENGLADRDDKYRKWWLDESVRALGDALEYGVNVRGYMHWSLLDNFEWSEGFWPKFGLVGIDPDTKERKIKNSGYYYRDLIKKYS